MDYKSLYEQSQGEIARLKANDEQALQLAMTQNEMFMDQLAQKDEEIDNLKKEVVDERKKIEELTDERDEYYDRVDRLEEEMNDKVESFCAYLTGDWKKFRAVEEIFRETYTEEFIQANKEALEQYGLFEDD